MYSMHNPINNRIFKYEHKYGSMGNTEPDPRINNNLEGIFFTTTTTSHDFVSNDDFVRRTVWVHTLWMPPCASGGHERPPPPLIDSVEGGLWLHPPCPPGGHKVPPLFPLSAQLVATLWPPPFPSGGPKGLLLQGVYLSFHALLKRVWQLHEYVTTWPHDHITT